MLKKRVIIQGDDLGYKPECDAGIAYAYEYGILTSTTVVANLMGKTDKQKYKEYLVKLKNKTKLNKPKLGVGVHLNITYGRPLSPMWPQKEFTRPFKGSGKPEEWQGSAWETYCKQFTKRQAEDEYKRQIELALEIFEGIDHLDGHQFTFSYEPFKSIYEKLASEYHLPIRPPAPLSEKPVYGGDFIYNPMIISKLREKGIKLADNYVFKLFFNESEPVKSFLREVEKIAWGDSTEIMLHPAKGEEAESWRLSDLNMLTNQRVIDYFMDDQIELINYSQL